MAESNPSREILIEIGLSEHGQIYLSEIGIFFWDKDRIKRALAKRMLEHERIKHQ